MLSRCLLDFSVGVGVFVTGLIQISIPFSHISWWVGCCAKQHFISKCIRKQCKQAVILAMKN